MAQPRSPSRARPPAASADSGSSFRPQEDEDPEGRLFRCVQPFSYDPTPDCMPFKSRRHLAGMQVVCPTCGNTLVRPWPPSG